MERYIQEIQLEPVINGVNFTTKGERKGEEEQLTNPEKDEITLTTRTKSSNIKPKITITCFKCGEEGHLAPNCPKHPRQEETASLPEQVTTGNQLLMQGFKTAKNNTALTHRELKRWKGL
jgi:6-phosphogluconolactonase/glucosamine-6-phosphate isomerase/deaminase